MTNKEIIREVENKGYTVCNQFDGFYGTMDDRYELWKGDKVLKAWLTIEDLKEML